MVNDTRRGGTRHTTKGRDGAMPHREGRGGAPLCRQMGMKGGIVLVRGVEGATGTWNFGARGRHVRERVEEGRERKRSEKP